MRWYPSLRSEYKAKPSELQKKHTKVAIQQCDTEGYALVLHILIQEDEGERIVTEYDVDPHGLSEKKAPLFLENVARIKVSKEILHARLETLKEVDFTDEKARELFRQQQTNHMAET